MKTINLLAITLTASIMSACTPPSDYKPNYQMIRVDYIDPPKHFKMKYTVVSTGKQHMVSSKHCGDWNRVKVNKHYVVDITRTGCDIIRSIK